MENIKEVAKRLTKEYRKELGEDYNPHKEKYYFTMLPKVYELDFTIPHGALRLLSIMWSMYSSNLGVFASNENLGYRMHETPREVRRKIQWLKNNGFIKVKYFGDNNALYMITHPHSKYPFLQDKRITPAYLASEFKQDLMAFKGIREDNIVLTKSRKKSNKNVKREDNIVLTNPQNEQFREDNIVLQGILEEKEEDRDNSFRPNGLSKSGISFFQKEEEEMEPKESDLKENQNLKSQNHKDVNLMSAAASHNEINNATGTLGPHLRASDGQGVLTVGQSPPTPPGSTPGHQDRVYSGSSGPSVGNRESPVNMSNVFEIRPGVSRMGNHNEIKNTISEATQLNKEAGQRKDFKKAQKALAGPKKEKVIMEPNKSCHTLYDFFQIKRKEVMGYPCDPDFSPKMKVAKCFKHLIEIYGYENMEKVIEFGLKNWEVLITECRELFKASPTISLFCSQNVIDVISQRMYCKGTEKNNTKHDSKGSALSSSQNEKSSWDDLKKRS